MRFILGNEAKEEPLVRLWLTTNGGGDHVALMAKKEGGGIQTLLHFHSDGRIRRIKGVDDWLGFALDEEGRVVIE